MEAAHRVEERAIAVEHLAPNAEEQGAQLDQMEKRPLDEIAAIGHGSPGAVGPARSTVTIELRVCRRRPSAAANHIRYLSDHAARGAAIGTLRMEVDFCHRCAAQEGVAHHAVQDLYARFLQRAR